MKKAGFIPADFLSVFLFLSLSYPYPFLNISVSINSIRINKKKTGHSPGLNI